MADVLHRTTLEYRRSVNTPDFPVSDWVINPDMSAASGVDRKYQKLAGERLVEMTQAEKDAVDANEANAAKLAKREDAKLRVDDADPVMLGMAIIMQDELKALKANSPKPTRTMDELKTALKQLIDSGALD